MLEPEAIRARKIKVATAALVQSVGGIEAAAATLERGKSGVGRWVNLHEPDHFIPVHEAARLEQYAPQPVVTEMLCRLAGGLFVPHINHGADEGSPEWLAMRLAKELGDISGAIAMALADDGRIDGGEAAAVLAEIDQLSVATAQLRGLMQRTIDGGAA